MPCRSARLHFVKSSPKAAEAIRSGRGGRRLTGRSGGSAHVPSLQKATHGQTRTYNSRLVLRTIYDHAPISRAEVARTTGLTRTSVSDLVGELLELGIALEVGRGPSSGGKAPILLTVADDSRHLI